MSEQAEGSSASLDLEKISQELKVRKEVLERLIVSFANTLADRMKTLEGAVEQMDEQQMRSILHEIKGTAGNLRLDRISEAEEPMHQAVKAGEGKEKLAEHLKILKERAEELQKFVAQ